jgi:hypothetical protein
MVTKFFGTHHEFLKRGCPVVKGIVAVTMKLSVVHDKPLIRLAVPVTISEVFVDYHLMPGGKANRIVKA